jgi:hypothetical protein
MVRRKYRAKTTIDYISNRTGEYKRVLAGEEFDDMNSVGVRNELAHGNIEEVE